MGCDTSGIKLTGYIYLVSQSIGTQGYIPRLFAKRYEPESNGDDFLLRTSEFE